MKSWPIEYRRRPVWLAMVALLAAFAAAPVQAGISPPCDGRFLNPVGDICWRCLLPLSIGAAPVMQDSNYPDTPNPAAPVCMCPMPPPIFLRFGLSAGWWEPTFMVEVTRTPFCMATLDVELPDLGLVVPGGVHAPKRNTADNEDFYHVHWYSNVYTEWLVREMDTLCMELTLPTEYMSELDPTWDNDELALLFHPESVLFANPIAQGACAADCVASTVGLPNPALFWCSGCQGTNYPPSGHANAHVGAVQATLLLAQRLGMKLSRLGLLWAPHAHSPDQYCYQHFDPIMDKSQYRTQMVLPIPQTMAGSWGGCCQPFGKSSFLWEPGREIPFAGENNFAYVIWQKRHCCLGP